MRHIDLFSGIGGFALAADRVFGDVEHIFCDNDKFCQQVLKKHWPNSKIYGDIRTLRAAGSDTDTDDDGRSTRDQKIDATKADKQTLDNAQEHYGKDAIRTLTNTIGSGTRMEAQSTDRQERRDSKVPQSEMVRQGDGESDAEGTDTSSRTFLLTGGFPCQPFSQAGQRKGTEDDRYLWPEMLRVIREFKPTWVIAENVRGLLTQGGGVVFEQVCLDLEGEGYDVQPLVIPAVAVNAPHRRDRVWFIANKRGSGLQEERPEQQTTGARRESSDVHNTTSTQDRRVQQPEPQRHIGAEGWERDWKEVAFATCDDSLDDGLPVKLDGFECTKSQHRAHQLKAYGNSIVPQVAEKIMRAIALTNPLKQ